MIELWISIIVSTTELWIFTIVVNCVCIHELIMGIHNSVMDIPLEVIFALDFSYQYVFISSISADTRRK